MKHTIDATNKGLGRLASEAARVLLGKESTAFQKNLNAKIDVEIINADKMMFSEKKLNAKKYISFSGFPGGLKSLSQKELIAKKGVEEVIWRAVYKMLPKNRLQPLRIKSLKIVK